VRAVIADYPAELIEARRRKGIDRWDEMWEGVLHMPPMPNREHQDFRWVLETWIEMFWAAPRGNRVHGETNVASPGGWPNNYRIPDLVLLTPDRFSIDRNVYFEGAPTVVVEVHSPGDEAYEKLGFYAHLGVPEVWIIDRDTRAPEVYVLAEGDYRKQPARDDGWIESPATGVLLRHDPEDRLDIQVADEPASRRRLSDRRSISEPETG